MKLLLINPNTSKFVTDAVFTAAQTMITPGIEISAVTGTYGVEIVSSRSESVLAAAEAIRLGLEYGSDYDCIILAISFDSGLRALREKLRVPIIGMTEAALLTATTVSSRFALITFGYHPVNIYRELCQSYGLESKLSNILSLPALSAEEVYSPSLIFPELIRLINETVYRDGTEAVILSGAIFANVTSEVEKLVEIPVLNGIREAVGFAQMLGRLRLKKPAIGSYRLPDPKSVQWPFEVIRKSY